MLVMNLFAAVDLASLLIQLSESFLNATGASRTAEKLANTYSALV